MSVLKLVKVMQRKTEYYFSGHGAICGWSFTFRAYWMKLASFNIDMMLRRVGRA